MMIDLNVRVWLTPDEVEEALVEAWRLWRRSPGGGRWPFASDGPWHLMSREASAGDWDARGVEGSEGGGAPELREGSLSIAEVERRDRVSGWLRHVGERDRKLVTCVVEQLGQGRRAPDFMALRGRFPGRTGRALGADGLRMRYGRALSAIAQRVGRSAD